MVIQYMYQCMKIAEFKALQSGTKSPRYLECNKNYDSLHPGTVAQNSSQIPAHVISMTYPRPVAGVSVKKRAV